MGQRDEVTIVIPGDDPPQIQGSPHLKRLEGVGRVVLYKDRPETLEEKITRAQDADIMINSRGIVKWPAEALQRLPKLKMASTCSIGTDMFDLEAARSCDVLVCNQPGRTAPVVAEHTLGLIFALSKRAAYFTSEIKAGGWPRLDNVFLQGKTLGIIGTGHIGSELSRLANALGMNVIAWTFNPSDEKAAAYGLRYVALEQLLGTADVVSLHISLTQDTHHLMGSREFGHMKKDALFINCGRGGLVDTDALIEALKSGHLGGAGIDVFDPEPIPAGHPLLSMDQVVLTPHCADMTPEGVDLLNEGAVDNVLAYLGGNPQNVVNP
ncbi:MAG: glycerate dehydrogenase [Candidatus Latescibacteria bacterium]|jgi:phosphoglycerate dehydrogenase-like enzyme|nr:glycerate dehydrogenase [Candidatus Latescibacterota bacterium]